MSLGITTRAVPVKFGWYQCGGEQRWHRGVGKAKGIENLTRRSLEFFLLLFPALLPRIILNHQSLPPLARNGFTFSWLMFFYSSSDILWLFRFQYNYETFIEKKTGQRGKRRNFRIFHPPPLRSAIFRGRGNRIWFRGRVTRRTGKKNKGEWTTDPEQVIEKARKIGLFPR